MAVILPLTENYDGDVMLARGVILMVSPVSMMAVGIVDDEITELKNPRLWA